MTTFRITNTITIEARYFDGSRNWGHVAKLYIDEQEVVTDRIIYYNRTWESYQFQSILFSIIGKAAKKKLLTKRQQGICNKAIKLEHFKKHEKEMVKVNKTFAQVGMVAALGNVFVQTQKARNDWKLKMITAGLGGKGLRIPDDWGSLDEDTKEIRLDATIKELTTK